MLLKCLLLARGAAVRNLAVVRASRGIDGVLWLLETVHGADAITILRAEGAVVGTGTRILRGLIVHNATSDLSQLSIGSDCHVGRQVLVDLASPVRIGDRVTISMRVMIITHTNVGDSRCGLPSRNAGIEIDDDAYIGAGATILPGVRIGKAAIIGAGAVVTRDVDPATTVIGIPAKALVPPTVNASATRPSAGAPNA